MALGGLALLEVAVSDAFQGAGFLQGRPQGSGDAEGLIVVGTSIGSRGGVEDEASDIFDTLGAWLLRPTRA